MLIPGIFNVADNTIDLEIHGAEKQTRKTFQIKNSHALIAADLFSFLEIVGCFLSRKIFLICRDTFRKSSEFCATIYIG